MFQDEKFDHAFSVWGNSTLGLLSFWWNSNRQVAGRGTTTIRSAETLPVLDFRTLTDEQLLKAKLIFDEFRDKELMPAFLADADPNRALLDRRVVCDLLGFDEDVYVGVRRLAAKWCAETVRPRRQKASQGGNAGGLGADISGSGAFAGVGMLRVGGEPADRWRREWDSNPRLARNEKRFSRPPP